jgi:hypothetical protein
MTAQTNKELRAILKTIQPNLIVSKLNSEELQWWLKRPANQPIVPKRLPMKTRTSILESQPVANRTTSSSGLSFIRKTPVKPPTVPHLPDNIRTLSKPPTDASYPPYPPIVPDYPAPAYHWVLEQQEKERAFSASWHERGEPGDIYDQLLLTIGEYIENGQSVVDDDWCVTPREPEKNLKLCESPHMPTNELYL